MADESTPPVGEPEARTDICDQNTVSTDTQNILKPRDGVTDRDSATEPVAEVLDLSTVSTELAQEAGVGRGDGVDEVVQQVEDVCIGGGSGEQWGGEEGGETGDGVGEGGGQGEDEEDETVREKPLETEGDVTTKVEDTTPQDPVKGLRNNNVYFSTAVSVHIHVHVHSLLSSQRWMTC